MKRTKTKFQGVFVRESSKRRHDGKPDRCYDICYRTKGKLVWEKAGWISEGYTAAMASHVRAERIRSIRHGEELPSGKKQVTFGQAWDKYHEWAKANRESHYDDKLRYEKHVKEMLGDMHLGDVSPFHLEKIKIGMTREGLSPQTIKHVLALVRQVFNKARKWGDHAGENPVSSVKMPSTRHTNRVRFLSRTEAPILLEELQKHSRQLYEIALVALHTGMRAGEIFNLRWGDVDLEHGVIHVLGPDMRRGPKDEDSRQAMMTGELKSVLGAKEPGASRSLVFKSARGTKITSISHTFDRIVSGLGFNEGVEDRRHKVVFHSLRHTFGSWLAMAGEDIRTIMELMGHSRIEQTMRYSHLCPDKKRQAIQSLEKMLSVPEAMPAGIGAEAGDGGDVIRAAE